MKLLNLLKEKLNKKIKILWYKDWLLVYILYIINCFICEYIKTKIEFLYMII